MPPYARLSINRPAKSTVVFVTGKGLEIPYPRSHEASLVINEENDRVLGRGADLPIAAQPSVKELFANAFIGLPCPKKTTGIRSVIER
jgi:hypothetical protein